MTIDVPHQHLRRSQLYRLHQRAGARFDDYGGALCVSRYGEIADEVGHARRLGLTDLSTLPRIGFKGRGAPDWVNNHGARLPGKPNRALTQTDGSCVVRLSEHEVLVLSGLSAPGVLVGELILDADSAAEQRAYLLPRADSHCWLALTGDDATQTLAKLCGVDMRPGKFSEGSVAQTSLARVNAIVIRNDLNEDLACFYIMCDVSMTEFLWESLLDAMQEFGGQPIGLAALRRIQQT